MPILVLAASTEIDTPLYARAIFAEYKLQSKPLGW